MGKMDKTSFLYKINILLCKYFLCKNDKIKDSKTCFE